MRTTAEPRSTSTASQAARRARSSSRARRGRPVRAARRRPALRGDRRRAGGAAARRAARRRRAELQRRPRRAVALRSRTRRRCRPRGGRSRAPPARDAGAGAHRRLAARSWPRSPSAASRRSSSGFALPTDDIHAPDESLPARLARARAAQAARARSTRSSRSSAQASSSANARRTCSGAVPCTKRTVPRPSGTSSIAMRSSVRISSASRPNGKATMTIGTDPQRRPPAAEDRPLRRTLAQVVAGPVQRRGDVGEQLGHHAVRRALGAPARREGPPARSARQRRRRTGRGRRAAPAAGRPPARPSSETSFAPRPPRCASSSSSVVIRPVLVVAAQGGHRRVAVGRRSISGRSCRSSSSSRLSRRCAGQAAASVESRAIGRAGARPRNMEDGMRLTLTRGAIVAALAAIGLAVAVALAMAGHASGEHDAADDDRRDRAGGQRLPAGLAQSRRRRRRRSAPRPAAAASTRTRRGRRTTSARCTPRGMDGRGKTIAVVDSYGSDTMAHDLHVYDQAWGLPRMCGEEGVDLRAGHAEVQRTARSRARRRPRRRRPRATAPARRTSRAWALEVALDVETAHAIAPGANILLVPRRPPRRSASRASRR